MDTTMRAQAGTPELVELDGLPVGGAIDEAP